MRKNTAFVGLVCAGLGIVALYILRPLPPPSAAVLSEDEVMHRLRDGTAYSSRRGLESVRWHAQNGSEGVITALIEYLRPGRGSEVTFAEDTKEIRWVTTHTNAYNAYNLLKTAQEVSAKTRSILYTTLNEELHTEGDPHFVYWLLVILPPGKDNDRWSPEELAERKTYLPILFTAYAKYKDWPAIRYMVRERVVIGYQQHVRPWGAATTAVRMVDEQGPDAAAEWLMDRVN